MNETNNTIVRVTNNECLERIEEMNLLDETNKKNKETLKNSLIESIENSLNILKKL